MTSAAREPKNIKVILAFEPDRERCARALLRLLERPPRPEGAPAPRKEGADGHRDAA